MVKLSKQELDTILNKCGKRDYEIFVETGTYQGETTNEMAQHFNMVHTIEIQPDLFKKTFEIFKNRNNIKCHFGDCAKVLPVLSPTLKENTVFWLDGHWSCGETGKGDKDVPLLEELKAINDTYNGTAVIIVDDYRLFNGKDQYVDWSEINENALLERVSGRVIQHFVEGDRFIIEIS
jgi:hypothetical protein